MKFLRLVVAVVLAASCGGSGKNPIAPQPVNRPPTIVKIELVGYNVAGHGESLPIRVEVSDPDGDPVTCRYAPEAGRVLIDGSGSGCQGTYIAPAAGLSDRIGVTATDTKGASTGSSATVALGDVSLPTATNPPASPPPPGPPNPQPTQAPPPLPTPAPTATPPPNPTPTPQPTPTPSPSANQPPVVSLSGGGQCHPDPTCTRSLTATAQDPEGQSLTYTWSGSGCSGTGSGASVVVSALTAHTCTVTVRDPLGATASASATVTGVNDPPRLGEWLCCWDPLVCGPTVCALIPDRTDGMRRFAVADDDTAGWTCTAVATNECRNATCSIAGTQGAIQFSTNANDGTCNLDLVIRDRWGAPSLHYQTSYPVTNSPQ